MTDGLTYRTDYFADRAAWDAFAALLADIFGFDVGPLDRLGGPDPAAMPFAFFDAAGICVANVSAFLMPLVVDGAPVLAAGLQSGAVRPDWRGRGLYRRLTERALAWCDARGASPVLLYTENPALYARTFEVLPEHSFVGAAPSVPGPVSPARALDLGRADDLALIRRLLADRAPVSGQVGLAGHGTMFLLNAALDPAIRLHYLPDDGVVVATGAADRFRLLDVVGGDIPALARILAAFGVTGEVEVCFPPDRLGWVGRAVVFEAPCALMARGPLPLAFRRPFMLPPTAAF
jgi:GNAT superfamily N-acetyltransferase